MRQKSRDLLQCFASRYCSNCVFAVEALLSFTLPSLSSFVVLMVAEATVAIGKCMPVQVGTLELILDTSSAVGSSEGTSAEMCIHIVHLRAGSAFHLKHTSPDSSEQSRPSSSSPAASG